MGLLRRKSTAEEAPAASVSAIFYQAPVVTGWVATAEFKYESKEHLVHLPALYFDEALHRDRRSQAETLLNTVETFVENVRSKALDDPLAASGGIVPMPPPQLVKDWGLKPWVTTMTVIEPSYRSYTFFRPRRHVAEVMWWTFWVYWDALVEFLVVQDEAEEIIALLDNLAAQCVLYRAHGLRSAPPGVIVAEAMTREAGKRITEPMAIQSLEWNPVPKSSDEPEIDHNEKADSN